MPPSSFRPRLQDTCSMRTHRAATVPGFDTTRHTVLRSRLVPADLPAARTCKLVGFPDSTPRFVFWRCHLPRATPQTPLEKASEASLHHFQDTPRDTLRYQTCTLGRNSQEA